MSPDLPLSDAEQRYADAFERRDAVYAEWEKLGFPLTTEGSRGQAVPHPLVGILDQMDRLCDKLDPNKKQKPSGPDPLAQIRARMDESPAAKRRAKSKGKVTPIR